MRSSGGPESLGDQVSALLLVAHGSADPRAGATTRALARAVAAARPGIDVRTSYLDHAGPRPGAVLFALAQRGHRAAAVVPLLLTSAFHGRIDLPGVLAEARAEGLPLAASQTDVLGPVNGRTHPLLLRALRQRLTEAAQTRSDVSPSDVSPSDVSPSDGSPSDVPPDGMAVEPDGVVLIAAGTRDDAARGSVDVVAKDLETELGVPCRAGFASGSSVTGAVAVAELRALGCRRVAIASYFLACGRLHDIAVASARSAGALPTAAEPLGDAFDIACLVLERADSITLR